MSLKSHAQLLCYFPSVLSNFATVVSWSCNLVKLHSELVSLYLIFGKERLVVLKVLLIITKKFVVTKHLRMRDMCQFSISNNRQLWVACHGTSSILWCSFFQCIYFEIIEIIEVTGNIVLRWVEFNYPEIKFPVSYYERN